MLSVRLVAVLAIAAACFTAGAMSKDCNTARGKTDLVYGLWAGQVTKTTNTSAGYSVGSKMVFNMTRAGFRATSSGLSFDEMAFPPLLHGFPSQRTTEFAPFVVYVPRAFSASMRFTLIGERYRSKQWPAYFTVDPNDQAITMTFGNVGRTVFDSHECGADSTVGCVTAKMECQLPQGCCSPSWT